MWQNFRFFSLLYYLIPSITISDLKTHERIIVSSFTHGCARVNKMIVK